MRGNLKAIKPLLMARFARERGLEPSALNAFIRIARAFTCFQLTELIRRVPKVLATFDADVPIVTALPDLFFDENVQDRPARVEGGRDAGEFHASRLPSCYREWPSVLNLPRLTRDLEIDYTALSFVAPQKVQFRYQLDGNDKDWQDAGTRRQAFYTDLKPGSYRFHVVACNNDGVWNESGAEVSFFIVPAFYQTFWFHLLCVIAAGSTIWIFYLVHLKRVTGRIQEQLAARLEERERIARELHDTLLQGFHGLMLRFQSVLKNIPAQAPARQMMESALDRADEVLLEGRQRVHDLREADMAGNSFSENLVRWGKNLPRLVLRRSAWPLSERQDRWIPR